MTMVLIEQLIATVERGIQLLRGIPEDQRTDVVKQLLEDLQFAVEQYRKNSE